jgi:DNA-binding MarR family transcriptional regulator
METNDIRTLKILEQVASGSLSSQRSIAKELNVSLGLANSFIKRLYTKGYVKVTTVPRNRIKYILTPRGMTEKTRLTYHFIQHSYNFYKASRQKFRQLFKDLEDTGVRRLVLFGASDLAEIAFLSLQETQIEVVAVVDDRSHNNNLLGVNVLDVAQVQELSFDRILIADGEDRDSVLDQLSSNGVPPEKIIFIA